MSLFHPYRETRGVERGSSNSESTASRQTVVICTSAISSPTPFDKTPCNVLVGFADVRYLSDPYKGYSQTGYIFTMENMAISWRSTKETLFATSSNHVEIIALHETVRECVWLRSTITHIWVTSGLKSTAKEPTCIYEDNIAYIEQMKLLTLSR